MGTSNLKSTPITNLDTIPVVANTSGEGAPGVLREVSGSVTTVAADGTSSTYALVRIPSTAKVKAVYFESDDTGGTGTVNVGLSYSTSTRDGTTVSNQGDVIDADFFASAIDISGAAVVRTDITNEAGFYKIDERNKAIWDAVGLTSDPGGFFDVVVSVAAALTNAGVLGVSVQYVD